MCFSVAVGIAADLTSVGATLQFHGQAFFPLRKGSGGFEDVLPDFITLAAIRPPMTTFPPVHQTDVQTFAFCLNSGTWS